jgi:exopolysaccharide biosynthesis polyprenyl glycosylphosphotransferase
LCQHPAYRLRPIGYLDDLPAAHERLEVPWLGRPEELPRLIAIGAVDRVLVAFSRRTDEDVLAVIRACDCYGVEVDLVPRLFELLSDKVRSYQLAGLPVISVSPALRTRMTQAVKLAFDVSIGLLLLLVAAPVLLVIAIAIAVDDGRPVVFCQTRMGRDGETFRLFKFRTMRHGVDTVTLAAAREVLDRGTIGDAVAAVKTSFRDDVTRVGRFLRRSSFDELPQLINVVRGDMSLVGPRPLRKFEVESLAVWQQLRHAVRPGMTGLWQVLGRSEIGWEERMQLDYSYVRHWSLGADLRILARTLPAVLRGRGAL